jgi:hypothetical protein
MENSLRLIKKLFYINCFFIAMIVLGKVLRREIIRLFPRSAYLFVNEIKQQNYFQQRYIFSHLKLKKIQFAHIKISNEVFYLKGYVFFDNPTGLECLAPIIQYKIIWIQKEKNKFIVLDQNYHKLSSIIPKRSVNHRVPMEISQKINSNLWKKIKKNKGQVIMFYKLIERYQ